jgi:hypothetical protein
MTTTLTASDSSVQPVNQAAVVDAALRSIYFVYESSEWLDLAEAIKENEEAKHELKDRLSTVWNGPVDCDEDEEDGEDGLNAFGMGMVAGMLYAANTGVTLEAPRLAELKATLDAGAAGVKADREAKERRRKFDEVLAQGVADGICTFKDGIVKLVEREGPAPGASQVA